MNASTQKRRTGLIIGGAIVALLAALVLTVAGLVIWADVDKRDGSGYLVDERAPLRDPDEGDRHRRGHDRDGDPQVADREGAPAGLLREARLRRDRPQGGGRRLPRRRLLRDREGPRPRPVHGHLRHPQRLDEAGTARVQDLLGRFDRRRRHGSA